MSIVPAQRSWDGSSEETSPSVEPPSKKPRVRKGFHRSRTGCLTCRKYHHKCDEQRDGTPDCLKCRNGQRECVWPENVTRGKDGSSPDTTSMTVPAARKDDVLVVANPSSTTASALVSLPFEHSASTPSSGFLNLDMLDADSPLTNMANDPLDPAFLDSLLGFTADNIPLIREPMEPSQLLYPDPGQRRLMRLFVREAEKLMVNISPQPQQITFLDLARILWSPEMGFTSDALRFSLFAIGALHEAWFAGRSDKAVLTRMVGVAKDLGEASSACLHTSMTLAKAGLGYTGVDETAFYAVVMLCVCQVLSGVNGNRKPFDMAFQLVDSQGGPTKILTAMTHSPQRGSIRKVLEFIAVMDVLDSLASARSPRILLVPDTAWWSRKPDIPGTCELCTVETTFGVSREAWILFAKVVDLVAQVKSGSVTDSNKQRTDSPAVLDFSAILLGMNAPTLGIKGSRENYDSQLRAVAMEAELDAWYGSEDCKLTLPRALHGNLIYFETARLLLKQQVRRIPRSDPRVQDNARVILSLLWDCHSRFGGVLYFMWPLLLASSAGDGELRATTLKILEAFSTTYMFDCSAALLVFHKAWAQADAGNQDVDVQALVRELGYQFL